VKESQGVTLKFLEHTHSNTQVELRRIQKLRGPLKITMEVKMDDTSSGTYVYESPDIPFIAQQMTL